MEENQLVRNIIKRREYIHYLITEEDIDSIKSKNIFAEIFFSAAFLLLGLFLSSFLSSNVDSYLRWGSLIFGLVFFVFAVFFYITNNRFISRIKLASVKEINPGKDEVEFKILSAFYGGKDKTDKLAALVKGGRLNWEASNTINGEFDDPQPGVKKDFKIIYRSNGLIFNRDYKEGDLVNLP
jgi:hypothetical protein